MKGEKFAGCGYPRCSCTLDKKVFEDEAASASVQRFAATAANRYEADDHSDGLLAGKSDGLDFH